MTSTIAPAGFPRELGPYLLLGSLGHGGMGEVLLAKAGSLEGAVRLVVIKTLRPDLVREPGYLGRFLDEARVAVQLHHPNICQVFDVGKAGDVPYLAMEHILGVNLRRLLDRMRVLEARLPTPLALHIACEALEGLDYAHRHRHPLTGAPLLVVHRDVSPHNVMLGFDGDVKLIDFGLATSALKEEETESQVVMGKVAYMSPEQARGDEIDATTDQFAAAVMLYEMLSGERFYGERKNIDIWQVVGRGGFRPDRLDALDPEIVAVLERALMPRPGERWRSCGELAAKLRALLVRRFEPTSRANLRGVMHAMLRSELESQEALLRSFADVVEASASRSAARPAAPVEPPKEAPVETGPTMTWSLTTAAAPPPRARSALALAGALSLLVVVGAALLLLVARERPDDAQDVVPAATMSPPDPAAAAPAEVAPTEVAPTEVAPAEVARAATRESATHVDDEEAPLEAPPPAAAAAAEPARPRRTPPRAREGASPTTSAPRRNVSFEQKLEIVRRCNESCAKGLRELADSGARVEPLVVDACFQRCVQ